MTEYKAVFNTGDVLTNESKRGIYKSMRVYFTIHEVFLAELSYNGTVIAYVWRTPKGLYVETAIGKQTGNRIQPPYGGFIFYAKCIAFPLKLHYNVKGL